MHTGSFVGLAAVLLLAGCATAPKHYPSQTAAHYVGKSLTELEEHWSVPWNVGTAGDEQTATWLFNQYNLAGCTVTVHANANGIIKSVEWTQGCGPKGTGAAPPTEGFGP